jgi:hypothetical protein
VIGTAGLFLGILAVAGILPAGAVRAKPAAANPVEERIEAMRSSFHITSAQESLWNDVAQAMRENAKAMTDLRKARGEHAPTLSAVDQLKAYSAAVETHADGLRKFIPVFQSLYESMSDAQKKAADAKFRDDARARAKRGK